jgi:hypothetical protein
MLPALTLDETQEILLELLEEVKVLSLKLSRTAQKIKQQCQAQGQNVSDADIMLGVILPNFESSIDESLNKILDVSLNA